MEIINKNYKSNNLLSKTLKSCLTTYNTVYLDIETTGLSPINNKVILVGLLSTNSNGLCSKQFFAENKNNEKELLLELAKELSKIDVIISYNGNSFDLPFLNKRFSQNNIDYKIPSNISFDLFKIIKKHGKNLCLPNYKLKTIEEYMDVSRDDKISGKESISLYDNFLKTRNDELKEIYLMHNAEDIYNMSKLINILNKFNINKILFENPVFIRDIDNKMVLSSCNIKANKIELIGCFSTAINNDYNLFEDGYTFIYSKDTNTYKILIDFYKKTDLFYLSLNDFKFTYNKLIDSPYVPHNILVFKDNNIIYHNELNIFIKKLLSNITTLL